MSLSFCHELCMDSALFLSVERSPGADAAECCDGVVKAGREGLDNTSCRTYSVQRHYCSFLYSNFTFLTLNVELTTHYGYIDRSSQYFQNSFLLTAEEFWTKMLYLCRLSNPGIQYINYSSIKYSNINILPACKEYLLLHQSKNKVIQRYDYVSTGPPRPLCLFPALKERKENQEYRKRPSVWLEIARKLEVGSSWSEAKSTELSNAPSLYQSWKYVMAFPSNCENVWSESEGWKRWEMHKGGTAEANKDITLLHLWI